VQWNVQPHLCRSYCNDQERNFTICDQAKQIIHDSRPKIRTPAGMTPPASTRRNKMHNHLVLLLPIMVIVIVKIKIIVNLK
jgi:hypothetical protein